MRIIKNTFHTATRARVAVGLATVAGLLGLSGALLVAGGAAASTRYSARSLTHAASVGHRSLDLGVFSHPLSATSARAAGLSARPAPPGAVLAAVIGQDTLYVWQPTSAQESPGMMRADADGATCLVDILAKGPESIGCGPTSQMVERGAIGINLPSTSAPMLSATALVPNGVTTVTITDPDGSMHSVPVSNNVVAIEDPRMELISYRLPTGEVRSMSVREARSGEPTPADGLGVTAR